MVGGGVNGDDDGAVGVGGAARVGIVGEKVLGAEFAVNAVEHGAEFLRRIGIEHGAAGRVGHGFQGVFTGGVSGAFVFCPGDNSGVKEGVGAVGGVSAGAQHVVSGCGA